MLLVKRLNSGTGGISSSPGEVGAMTPGSQCSGTTVSGNIGQTTFIKVPMDFAASVVGDH